ncbi:MAG: hypothetical protein H7195_07865, partial [Chryseobacterium sp.]|nr:hypothetical protein [Chryseobacterium sp.]
PSKKSGIDISTDLQSFKSDDSKNILVLNEKFTLLKNYLKENSLSIDFNTGKVLVSDQKNATNDFSNELEDNSVINKSITYSVKNSPNNIVPLSNIQVKNILSILSGFQINSILTEKEEEKPKTKVISNFSYKKDVTKPTETVTNQANNATNDFSNELYDPFVNPKITNDRNTDGVTPKIINLELINAPNKNLSINNNQILHETLKILKKYLKDNNIKIDNTSQDPIIFVNSEKNVASNNIEIVNNTKDKSTELYNLGSKPNESSLKGDFITNKSSSNRNENNIKQNNHAKEEPLIEHEQKNPEIISNYNSVLLENKSQILNSSSNVAYHTKENDLSNDPKSNLKNPLVIDESVKNINHPDLKTPSQTNIFDKEKIAKSFETKFNNISVASSTILENSIVESLSHPDDSLNSSPMNKTDINFGSKLDTKSDINTTLNPKIDNQNIIKNSVDIVETSKINPSKKSGIDISTDLQSFKSDDSKNILVLNEKFTLLKNYLKENSLSID